MPRVHPQANRQTDMSIHTAEYDSDTRGMKADPHPADVPRGEGDHTQRDPHDPLVEGSRKGKSIGTELITGCWGLGGRGPGGAEGWRRAPGGRKGEKMPWSERELESHTFVTEPNECWRSDGGCVRPHGTRVRGGLRGEGTAHLPPAASAWMTLTSTPLPAPPPRPLPESPEGWGRVRGDGTSGSSRCCKQIRSRSKKMFSFKRNQSLERKKITGIILI